MGLPTRVSSSWVSNKVDRALSSSRGSIIRSVFVIVTACFITYFLLLPVFYFSNAVSNLSTHTRYQPLTHKPGEDTIKHFAGSRECGITQADIYDAPWPTVPQVSPFCKNRATLLEALSGGGRHGFDEPYAGKGCTYKWFSTPEICMILERFNAVVFTGNDIAQTIYQAFNILLREDLALGSLQQWLMTEEERTRCKCDNQFIEDDCRGYAIKSMDEVKKNEAGDKKESPYFCERVSHAYIPIDSVPASAVSQSQFKDMLYSKPKPWQPSPVVFSFGHGSSLDVATTTRALDEWTTLATAAERNIPMLFLGSTALGHSAGPTSDKGNGAVWRYLEEMTPIAKEKHFDVLSLYNLTVQSSTPDGEHFGGKVVLVEAMMIINWLSKLETS